MNETQMKVEARDYIEGSRGLTEEPNKDMTYHFYCLGYAEAVLDEANRDWESPYGWYKETNRLSYCNGRRDALGDTVLLEEELYSVEGFLASVA